MFSDLSGVFFHSSLVNISRCLEAMIFQFRVDMFFRQNNEKAIYDFIMCVCVYLNTCIHNIKVTQMIFYIGFPDYSSFLI